MCKCLAYLTSWQTVEGWKGGPFRWIDTGKVLDILQGQIDEVGRPVLYAMKETKAGRMALTTHWMPVKFCPNCGSPVAAWAEVVDLTSEQAPL